MAKDFMLTLDRFTGLNTGADPGAPCTDGASGNMKNFKITQKGHLKLRNGYTVLQRLEGGVRLLWYGALHDTPVYLALVGDTLYASADAFASLRQIGRIPDAPPHTVCPIEFGEKLYLLTGNGIYCFDGGALIPIEPYRPLVRIGTPPQGGGVPFEDANFLTGAMRQSFSPDGESRVFRLALERLRSIDHVCVEGRYLAPGEYQSDPFFGKVTLSVAPDAGTDTVEISFTSFSDESDKIHSCRYGLAYGGKNDSRVFLYGNPDQPSARYYSGLVDGEPSFSYFPQSNYSLVGFGEPITSIVQHYDRQLIFTPSAAYYSYPETATDETGKEYLSFPVYTLSALKGNIARGVSTLLNNLPLSVMPDGLYLWTNTAIRDERNAVCCSEKIASELMKRDLGQALYFNRRSHNELFIVFEDGIFVYHYRLNLFYYYDGVLPAAFVEDGENRLFFGTADGKLCRVGGYLDDKAPIEAYWESGCLYCGAEGKSKNLSFLTVGADAEQISPLELEWCADNAVFPLKSAQNTLSFGEKLFGFAALDFADLRFETARRQKSFTRRVTAKRFRYIKLKLTHPAQSAPITIFYLLLRGRINDQTI